MMSDDHPLLFDRRPSGVALLTINRPRARNALDIATMQAFAAAVARLQADADLRAVVITGAGDHSFCSGGDLHELSTYDTEDRARYFSALMGDALLALESLPVPVFAAINGYALGGGAEVAVACDLRVADMHARMGFVHVRLAVTPGWGAGQRLLRLVGYSRAMQILLRGRVMHATELEALGLVNKVVPPGQALAHALQSAEHVAAMPPELPRSIKALLRAGLEQPYTQALATERDLFPPLWVSEAHDAAVQQFLDRHTRDNAVKRS